MRLHYGVLRLTIQKTTSLPSLDCTLTTFSPTVLNSSPSLNVVTVRPTASQNRTTVSSWQVVRDTDGQKKTDGGRPSRHTTRQPRSSIQSGPHRGVKHVTSANRQIAPVGTGLRSAESSRREVVARPNRGARAAVRMISGRHSGHQHHWARRQVAAGRCSGGQDKHAADAGPRQLGIS